MKLAFIHSMRTGGSYALSLLSAAGVPLVCPFIRGLNRDWNRQELIQLAISESAGCIHSHQIAWDEETVAWVKSHGWRTFTILRDPCEQLISLWHFCGCQGGIDRFILDLIEHQPTLGFTHHFWELPKWWRDIDVLVPNGDARSEDRSGADLYGEILSRLGLPRDTPDVSRCNGRQRIASPSESTLAAVRESPCFENYRRALWRISEANAPEEDLAALAVLVRSLDKPVCLEVGSFIGSTAAAMARAGASEVHCVDLWNGAPDVGGRWRADDRLGLLVKGEFDEATRGLPVIGYRSASTIEAAKWKMPLDLVFIDGNHDYEQVRADIAAWWPHIRPGGILCGHDYCDYFSGAKRAVDESGPREIVGRSVWWRRKGIA